MSNVNTKVAALVVTYSRKELLRECLSAILSQKFQPSKVVVVDNASTDGTSKLFEENAEFSGNSLIEYHQMVENLGGAGGFKEGLRICSETDCDWVWLMDDDCIAKPETLFELVNAAKFVMETQVEPSFFASCVYGINNEPMNVPTVDTRSTKNGYADWYFALNKGLVEIESATFVSLLINAKAIRRLGLPIASFFIWGDDTEYTTRLTHHFGPAFLVGSSEVVHKRANAKSLNIKHETDLNRISNFHRLYKNNLVVRRFHHGKSKARKMELLYVNEAFRNLRAKDVPWKIRKARASAIFKGVRDYAFKRYDLEDLDAFKKNR